MLLILTLEIISIKELFMSNYTADFYKLKIDHNKNITITMMFKYK